ncbi:hypothetical protein IJ765_00855 [Candidatus Saccharibacteria bacterium]|nr:hypothetical protein [Candidatus Saccharibacteria bacterium]
MKQHGIVKKASAILSAVIVLLSIVLSLPIGQAFAAGSTDSAEYKKALATAIRQCYDADILQTPLTLNDYDFNNGAVTWGDTSTYMPATYGNVSDNGLYTKCRDILQNSFQWPDASASPEDKAKFLTDTLGYTKSNGNSEGECFYFNYTLRWNSDGSTETIPTDYICADKITNGKIDSALRIETAGGNHSGSSYSVQFSADSSKLTIDCAVWEIGDGGGGTVAYNIGDSWSSFKNSVQSRLLSNASCNQKNHTSILGPTGFSHTLDPNNIPTQPLGDISSSFTIADKSAAAATATKAATGTKYTTMPAFINGETFALYSNYITDYYNADIMCDGTDNEKTAKKSQGYVDIAVYSGGTVKTGCIAKPQKNENESVATIDGSNHFGTSTGKFADIAAWMNSNAGSVGSLDGLDVPDATTHDASDTDPVSQDGQTADDSSSNEPTCFNSAESLGWILCPILSGAQRLFDFLYEHVIEPFLQVRASMFSTDTFKSWQTFQTFANIIFVILLLVVIISQLTGVGIDNLGIKRILPRLIVAVILVNLSYILCLLAIDVSNILGNGLHGLFNSLADVQTGGTITVGGVATTIGSGLLTAILGALVGAGLVLAYGGGMGILLAILPVVLAGIISLFFTFVLLGARQAGVVILTVISPVAVVMYMLPNTRKWFDRWIKMFSGLLMLYPIVGVMIGGGNFASKLLLAAADSSDQGFFFALSAMLVGIVPFFFIPTLLRGSFQAIGNLGNRIGQLGRNLGGRASGALRNSEGYRQRRDMERAGIKRVRQADGTYKYENKNGALQNWRRNVAGGKGVGGRLIGGTQARAMGRAMENAAKTEVATNRANEMLGNNAIAGAEFEMPERLEGESDKDYNERVQQAKNAFANTTRATAANAFLAGTIVGGAISNEDQIRKVGNYANETFAAGQRMHNIVNNMDIVDQTSNFADAGFSNAAIQKNQLKNETTQKEMALYNQDKYVTGKRRQADLSISAEAEKTSRMSEDKIFEGATNAQATELYGSRRRLERMASADVLNASFASIDASERAKVVKDVEQSIINSSAYAKGVHENATAGDPMYDMLDNYIQNGSAEEISAITNVLSGDDHGRGLIHNYLTRHGARMASTAEGEVKLSNLATAIKNNSGAWKNGDRAIKNWAEKRSAGESIDRFEYAVDNSLGEKMSAQELANIDDSRWGSIENAVGASGAITDATKKQYRSAAVQALKNYSSGNMNLSTEKLKFLQRVEAATRNVAAPDDTSGIDFSTLPDAGVSAPTVTGPTSTSSSPAPTVQPTPSASPAVAPSPVTPSASPAPAGSTTSTQTTTTQPVANTQTTTAQPATGAQQSSQSAPSIPPVQQPTQSAPSTTLGSTPVNTTVGQNTSGSTTNVDNAPIVSVPGGTSASATPAAPAAQATPDAEIGDIAPSAESASTSNAQTQVPQNAPAQTGSVQVQGASTPVLDTRSVSPDTSDGSRLDTPFNGPITGDNSTLDVRSGGPDMGDDTALNNPLNPDVDENQQTVQQEAPRTTRQAPPAITPIETVATHPIDEAHTVTRQTNVHDTVDSMRQRLRWVPDLSSQSEVVADGSGSPMSSGEIQSATGGRGESANDIRRSGYPSSDITNNNLMGTGRGPVGRGPGSPGPMGPGGPGFGPGFGPGHDAPGPRP